LEHDRDPTDPAIERANHTNAQLRAAKLDTPLSLDLLVLENGCIKCTWIDRPCKEPNKWQKIDMKVQVRTQPVSTKLWKACRPTQETSDSSAFDRPSRTDDLCEFAWGDLPGDSNLAFLILLAMVKAVIGTLWADLPGMCAGVSSKSNTPDQEARLGPINSIEHIGFEFVPARDEAGKVLESPYWDEELISMGYNDPDPHYDANDDPRFVDGFLCRIEIERGAAPGHVSLLALRGYEIDQQPLLTHIRSLSIRTPRTALELTPQEMVVNSGYFEDEEINEIMLKRKDMGWDDG
jgi:hypothetical protein